MSEKLSEIIVAAKGVPLSLVPLQGQLSGGTLVCLKSAIYKPKDFGRKERNFYNDKPGVSRH